MILGELFNFSIIVFSILMLFRNRNYNINPRTTVYIFILFFFGLAPLIQKSSGITFWGRPEVDNELFLLANSLVFLFILSFEIGYNFKIGFSSRTRILHENHVFIMFFIVLLCAILVLNYYEFEFTPLFYRVPEEYDITRDQGVYYLLISKFIRPLPAILYLVFIVLNKKQNFASIFCLIYCLIFLFPFGLPRFIAGAIYFPILFLTFNSLIKNIKVYFVIAFSFFVLFPLGNLFRYQKMTTSIYDGMFLDIFKSPDFDTFNSIIDTIELGYISYGNQLLGVLLFWVPRNIWPNKPIGSGALVGSELGYTNLNVSSNIIAEGWINFGLFGVILFALVIGIISRNTFVPEINDHRIVWGSIFSLLIFFIMRGDLMSSFAYSLALYLNYLLCLQIISKIKN